MLGIAMTYIVTYHLFSTANYVLKVKLCHYLFCPMKKIYFTSFFYDNKIVKCTNTVTKT